MIFCFYNSREGKSREQKGKSVEQNNTFSLQSSPNYCNFAT